MKISEMIKSLEYSKESYGDIEIDFNVIIDGVDYDLNDTLYFEYKGYEEGDKLGIQNYPY